MNKDRGSRYSAGLGAVGATLLAIGSAQSQLITVLPLAAGVYPAAAALGVVALMAVPAIALIRRLRIPLGVNFTFGWNVAKMRALPEGVTLQTPLPLTATLTPRDVTTARPFYSVGLDLRAFAGLFGKVTGLTVGAPATTSGS
jgi:hypothetical protein